MSGEHPRATTNTIECGGTYILQMRRRELIGMPAPSCGIKLYKLCEAMANFAHTRQTNARAVFLPMRVELALGWQSGTFRPDKTLRSKSDF